MTTPLPLRKLFEQLLQTGLPLGVDQYNLAVEALVQSIEDGFNLTDIEAVKRLCQTVWVKSPAEKHLFEQCWQELVSTPLVDSKTRQEAYSTEEVTSGQDLGETQAERDNKDTGNDSEGTEEYAIFEGAEIQVATAVPVTWQEGYYFPVSRQQLWEGWQKFQPELPRTAPSEIDIPATVEQVAKEGFFTKPVLTAPVAVTKPQVVLLLIDQQGSMTPFHPFCRHLVKIWQGARVCYFQNCPTDTLYRDPQLRQAEDLTAVLEQLPTNNTVAIVISDAGAAKRRLVPSRWEETVDFLNILTDEVQRVAWLNPLPRCRWFDSTAEEIAQIYPKQVPMFTLEPLEWKQMLQWLRWGENSALQFVQQREQAARKSWHPTNLNDIWDWEFNAAARVDAFARQYGQAHLHLACHAAFPLTLTPDLLYHLRQKFLVSRNPKESSPWYAVADVLLSDWCQVVDTELTDLYEMEREIRNELLHRCQRNFGEQRLEELSKFLITYLDKQVQKQELPVWLEKLYQMQHWAALAYTKHKDEAAQKLAESLKQAYLYNNKADLVRWSELAATIAPALSEEKYQPLLVVAKGYGAEARGIAQGTRAARQEWERLFGIQETATVAGVKLTKPGSVLGRITLKTFTTVTVNGQGKIIKQERKQAQYFTEDLGNSFTLEMVSIPGGTFDMGSPKGQGEDDERPQHQVKVKRFFMGKYPVTQAQWQAVADLPEVERNLNPKPSYFDGANRPVEQVSWDDAVEFCARLSQKTGRNYRLPSEAEWEYACRARTNTPFHFGETIIPDLANYKYESASSSEPKDRNRQQTTPVDNFQVANAFGLSDMHGNVWEWCADPKHDNYEGAPKDGSVWQDQNPNENQTRIMRGGSWFHSSGYCRAAFRGSQSPDVKNYLLGLRVVCSFL